MARSLSSRWYRLVAGALVALMAGVSLAPILHSGVGHDPDCEPVIVVHDAAQHRFSAPPSGLDELPSGEHCLVCHLVRSHRSSAAMEVLRTHDLAVSLVGCVVDRSFAGTAAVTPLPARAPPVLG